MKQNIQFYRVDKANERAIINRVRHMISQMTKLYLTLNFKTLRRDHGYLNILSFSFQASLVYLATQSAAETWNRPFAGQGHVTMSIIKKVVVQNGCQKWKEHDDINKFANFEDPVTWACLRP